MSAKHTPTPWTALGDSVFHKGGGCIALTDTDLMANSINCANAAFIVRACNAHEELVAAADDALNTLIGCCIPAGGCDDRKAILDTQMRLRKVLEAVGVTYRDEP